MAQRTARASLHRLLHVHDSADWMHPERIAPLCEHRQQNQDARPSLSQCSLISESGRVMLRKSLARASRVMPDTNPASLLVITHAVPATGSHLRQRARGSPTRVHLRGLARVVRTHAVETTACFFWVVRLHHDASLTQPAPLGLRSPPLSTCAAHTGAAWMAGHRGALHRLCMLLPRGGAGVSAPAEHAVLALDTTARDRLRPIAQSAGKQSLCTNWGIAVSMPAGA
jgi:hypothetical protein